MSGLIMDWILHMDEGYCDGGWFGYWGWLRISDGGKAGGARPNPGCLEGAKVPNNADNPGQ